MTKADTRWWWTQAITALTSLVVLVWAVTVIMKPPLAPLPPPAPAPVVVAPAPPIDRTTAFKCGYLAGRQAVLRQLKLPGEVLGSSDECPDQAAVSGSLARAK
jgi:hypothetical protein